MLVGATIEFRVVDNPHEYVKDGCIIAKKKEYCCLAIGDGIYVTFSSNICNQIIIITPNARNIDPDGGMSFITTNVVRFIEALISEKTYLG